MASELYKTLKYKCPGSLMIMGEHAVLHGKPAIVASINQYLEVKLDVSSINNTAALLTVPLVTIETTLDSPISYTQELDKITIVKPLDYILAVIQYFQPQLAKLACNYKFTVTSEINHQMGLGSSAAIIIATIHVILDFLDQDLDKYKILEIGKQILLQVQGSGSGADLAASLCRGVLWYEMEPIKVEKLHETLPLVAVYSGYKLSTASVIAKINRAMSSTAQNSHYSQIFNLIADLVYCAKDCIVNENWTELGQLFNMHYGLQEALGVSDENLSKIVYQLKSHPSIVGAKISGSGLGDCVIGLGITEEMLEDIKSLLNINMHVLTKLQANTKVHV